MQQRLQTNRKQEHSLRNGSKAEGDKQETVFTHDKTLPQKWSNLNWTANANAVQ